MTDLPSSWREVPLDNLVNARSGDSKLIKGRLASAPGPDLVPAYSASGQDVWCHRADYEVDGIVLSAVGARCGKAFLALGFWTAIANTHALVPNAAADAKFLWYRLNDERFWIRSGSAQPFVKVRDSLQQPVAAPPLAEQLRIVTAVEEYFSHIEAAERELHRAARRLELFRRSASAAAFDVAAAREPLAELTDPARPICYGILKPRTTGVLTVPYVEVRSIRNGRIDLSSLHRTTNELHQEFRRSSLRPGDVVLAIRGSFDRAAVVPAELEDANVSRDVARISPGETLNPAFLAHYLSGPQAFAYFAGAARGVAVRGVNIGDLKKLPVPVLSLEEQAAILERLEGQLSLVDALDAEVDAALQRSKALRRSILEQAFTGKLVPQDPADEPASALLERIAAELAAAPKPTRRQKVSA